METVFDAWGTLRQSLHGCNSLAPAATVLQAPAPSGNNPALRRQPTRAAHCGPTACAARLHRQRHWPDRCSPRRAHARLATGSSRRRRRRAQSVRGTHPGAAQGLLCRPRWLVARCVRLLHLHVLADLDQRRIPHGREDGSRGNLPDARLPAGRRAAVRLAGGEVRPPPDPYAQRRELFPRAARHGVRAEPECPARAASRVRNCDGRGVGCGSRAGA